MLHQAFCSCQHSSTMVYRSQTRCTTAKHAPSFQKRPSFRFQPFQAPRRRIDRGNPASSCPPQALGAPAAEHAAAWPGVNEGTWKWKGYNIRCVHVVARSSMRESASFVESFCDLEFKSQLQPDNAVHRTCKPRATQFMHFLTRFEHACFICQLCRSS